VFYLSDLAVMEATGPGDLDHELPPAGLKLIGGLVAFGGSEPLDCAHETIADIPGHGLDVFLWGNAH